MLQDQQDRRMDALARLCKSTSTTCVAICYIKDEFYITANSLYSTKSHALRGRGEKKLKELVTTIWSYLRNINVFLIKYVLMKGSKMSEDQKEVNILLQFMRQL